MRSPTDPCLLCEENHAIDQNSHILSKFISTGFLGDNPRRGYELNSYTFFDGKRKIVQDSPKEHYILYEDCESYFGVLETIAGIDLKMWEEKWDSGEYSSIDIGRGSLIINCNTARKRAIHLFIYSLFWRSDISSLDGFADFQIDDKNFKEDLKWELYRFRSTTQKKLMKMLDNSLEFNFFPSSVFTVYSMTDPTENLIMVPPGYPYQIITDSFAFYIFRDENDIENKDLQLSHNLKEEDCRIIALPENLWKKAFLDPAYKLFAVQAVQNRKNK